VKVEIEAKIKVESLEKVAGQLEGLGAVHEHREYHFDSYFVDAGSVLTRGDRGLRLRQLTVGDKVTAIVTYKGPREQTRFKSRREIEVEVADIEAMAVLLEELGFRKRLAFEKRRDLWRLNDCEVCLDELPLLGSFVEVEGPGECEIDGVLSKLGLAGASHISEGYSRLMRDRIFELGLDKHEILFDDING